MSLLPEDDILQIPEDANLEAGGLDTGDTPEETESIEEEVSTEKDTPIEEDIPLFNEKQQEEVNKIVKSRLERQEAKLVKDLSRVAGVSLGQQEVSSAAKLWGLLKENPVLSKELDDLITASLTRGNLKVPVGQTLSSDPTENRLEFKEAILDLKASDPLFYKNADKILAWAENEDYVVTDSKSLKMAFLAWKGVQGKLASVVQNTTEQRKQLAKKEMQKKATVQTPKAGQTVTKNVDYRKMADSDILVLEGMKLFTED